MGLPLSGFVNASDLVSLSETVAATGVVPSVAGGASAREHASKMLSGSAAVVKSPAPAVSLFRQSGAFGLATEFLETPPLPASGGRDPPVIGDGSEASSADTTAVGDSQYIYAPGSPDGQKGRDVTTAVAAGLSAALVIVLVVVALAAIVRCRPHPLAYMNSASGSDLDEVLGCSDESSESSGILLVGQV
jgi:hypothetical protein